MKYKIISTRQFDENIFTEVEYNFDGKLLVVEISHFAPKSVQEVEDNIKNRAASELAKMQISEHISNIITDIPIDIETPIE